MLHRVHTSTMAAADAMRVSDAERDAVLDRLREALVDGRIDQAELSERTDATLRARTVGDLRPLTADLPPGPARPLAVQRRPTPGPGAGQELAIRARTGLAALLGAFSWGWVPIFVACTLVWVISGHHGGFWPAWLLIWAAFSFRGHHRHGRPTRRDQHRDDPAVRQDPAARHDRDLRR